jgi:uncharacterized phage protein (TIGR01671 family)
MRQIKFRCWDKKNAHMFYPDSEGEFERQIEGEQVGSDFNYNDLFSGLYNYLIPLEFTGLKDKNGKEIYEGDVLKRSKEEKPSFVAVIEFSNGQFVGATHPYINHMIPVSKLSTCDYGGGGYDEVIGNIYEHPELNHP